ncbi:sulfotransferase [Alteromonadaceae bacterium BrNp21-10]|nr:sulfotransferase [Alteromonadaceae bacterium BrNp21-10]
MTDSHSAFLSDVDFQQQCKQIQQQLQQANFAAAITSSQQLIQQNLGVAECQQAQYLLVVARRYAGQLEQALTEVSQLVQLNSSHSRAYQEQGYILQALQRDADAAQAFEQAISLNSALLGSWKALVSLHQQYADVAAARIAQQQVEYLQQLPPAILGARDMMYEGKLHQAEQLCRQFLQANQHHVDAMSLLAEIGIQLRIYDDAEFLLESCVELQPEHQRARAEYLALLVRLGKYKPALQQAEVLLASEPENPAYLISMGNIQVGLGNTAQGIDCYQQVLNRQPYRAGVQLQLGHAYKAAGQFDAAIAAYQRSYQIKADFGDAYWSLANTKTYKFSATELEQIQQLEAQPGTQQEDRIQLCFAAGKAFEDDKDYAQSFDYYQRGNQLKQQQLAYSADNTAKQIDAQIKHCTADLFSQRGQFGLDDPAPIFIVGLPRAGSTLLEQILASHSMVDGTMELHNILGLAMRLRGRGSEAEVKYPANLWELDTDFFQRFGQQFIKDTQVYRGTGAFFIDKMPNNFLHIGLIRLILPTAKIIDARRHPMSCCFSGFKQLFAEGQDFSYSLDDIGRYYRDYERLMAHWDEVLPGFVLRVQHEDVVQDLAGQVRRMLDFCGLPFEQNCVDFHQTQRTIKTPSSEQVRQPIYTTGLQQWKHFEAYLQPLKTVLDYQD